MKGPTRSPGLRRAIERARRLGYTVAFVDYVPDARCPMVVPPQGMCDHVRRRIRVGTIDLRTGAPCNRSMLLAILEHELEHAEGRERGTDRPEFGLRCGGTLTTQPEKTP